MLSNQGYIETQELLDKKYKKLNSNIQQNLIIEGLIKKLDDNIVNFRLDLERYRIVSDNIKDKINEFDEKEVNNLIRNIYVDKISNDKIKKKYIGCYKNEKNQINVLLKVTELYNDNKGSFMVNNTTMGGDPLPGKQKKLYIKYSYNGETIYSEWTEKDPNGVKLPYPNAIIVSAMYGEPNSMKYVGEFNRKQCKEYAFNTQNKYFSMNVTDGNNQCFVGNNLYDVIKDGTQIKTTPIWQHNFNVNNSVNIDGGFAFPTGGYLENKDNQRYTRGWALSNGFKGTKEECNTLCQQQPECTSTTGSSDNKCTSTLYETDERCYCSFSTNLQLRILNTTFAVVDHNNKVIYSNDFVTANSELNQSGNVENTTPTTEGFESSFNWNKYRQTFNVPSSEIPVNPNKDMKVKLHLKNNGKLVLKDFNNNTVIWEPSYSKEKSTIVNEWIPTNDPTNKYKRSHIITGEFLDAGESISSPNGKYKLEFSNTGIKIMKANSACAGKPKMGDENTNALYMINNTAYKLKKKTSSSSNPFISYPNMSLGECIQKCDDVDECQTFEYNKKTDNCSLKSSFGAQFEQKKSLIGEKQSNYIMANSQYLGKVGYVDEDNNLHEYPRDMIKYSDDSYEAYNKTTSLGNIVKTLAGSDIENAIIECNKLTNCGGFVYNTSSNTISLYDESIFPKSGKYYDKNSSLYIRSFSVENHNSCPKNIERVSADVWKNYELLNRITMFNGKNQKCGLINFIDSDLNELNTIYTKLNSYTNTIDDTIRQLIDMNIIVKEDVLKIQNKITQTMSFIVDTNQDLNRERKHNNREGFVSTISCGLESKNNNILNYAVIGLLVAGFLAYTRR